MYNIITYRKLETFGWHVVGYTAAKNLGFKNYALHGCCARGHTAPMSVEKKKCIKCIAIEARKKGPELTKAQSFEYWRKRLKLPKIENPIGMRYVYVVENMPYTKLGEAAEMTGLTNAVIYQRCSLETYTTFHKIPTKFKRSQHYIYYCGHNQYDSIGNAAKGEKMKAHLVVERFHSNDYPQWFKSKIM